MKPSLAILVLAALCGCAGRINPNRTAATSQPVHESDVQVRIDNFTFTPATVIVARGTRVTWINHDDVPHTATSTTKVFGSNALDTDDSFSFVFATPGAYPYYCAVHPHMTGEVIVH